MPEFRQDPITGTQVIIAPGRAERPGAFSCAPPSDVPQTSDPDCPFCPGNESQTPREVSIYAATDSAENPGKDNWSVRVVPNLYPALDSNTSAVSGGDGFFARCDAGGRHEVVVESRRHVESFTRLSSAEASHTFEAYRERFLAWKQGDLSIAYPLAFKNCGPAAGASLFHAHSQLMGMRCVPPFIESELRGAATFHDQHGGCVFCHLIERELLCNERLVDADEDFVVFCPFASRAPYEMWLLPRQHGSCFENESTHTISKLALRVQECLRRLEQAVPGVAYNYVIHTAPFPTQRTKCDSYYHWHVEIIPRVARLAGFEWGTGCLINPLAPEQAAAVLSQFSSE